jgi:Ni/Co efflux regulator RcnB
MKKLLTVLIALAVVGTTLTAVAADKKPVATKKIAKKHQKFDGSKVADDKPTKPVAKKKK